MSAPPKQRKIAFMGFRSVGKSSLIIQFVENHFVDNYEPTIENTFHKSLKLGGQEYHLQVVDTAGQDEYSIIPQSYFMNINGYVLVYSVNSEKSFSVAKFVYQRLLDMKGQMDVPVVLVANKTDLRMERVVSYEDGKKLADSWKAPFIEASAKENSSVREIFEKVVQCISQQENGGTQTKTSCSLS
ncbi:GTP-binding protein Rheb-like isoform X1 [Pomacea canaliculata]|uniref:GTP-binding protein Rheb-like isoform X1 n=1 Tax=Pomacea canaliculata TaxID=400727 RepID=UPI000D72DBE6|nr:GTP-binding protein Rheb-like isoform X1 [Pomacea canaliculata]